MFLGVHATNPVDGEQIPVYAADYVLAEYGTGAVMAVPGARPARPRLRPRPRPAACASVVDTGPARPGRDRRRDVGRRRVRVLGPLDGLTDKTAGIARIVEQLQDDGVGETAVTFRLRDWLLSRQRYWGAPIPIIHCPDCGEVAGARRPAARRAAAPDRRRAGAQGHLAAGQRHRLGQRRLPAVRRSGQAGHRHDGHVRRLVLVLLPLLQPAATEGGPFDPDDVRRWMPVAQYVGGVEHAILHLLYMRFFTKVLFDMGLVDFVEPMRRLLNQGQVINQGRAMSKSLGNGVDLGAQIDAFGVDAVRLTVVFAGPPEEDIDWADVSPAGSLKFLQRAYRFATDVTSAPGTDPATGDRALRRETHRLLADVTAALESQRFNVAVARVMEMVNAARRAVDTGAGPADPAVREAAEVVTVALSLVAPYVGRGDVGAARPRPVGRRRTLAAGRPVAPGRRDRDLRVPGAGQGPRPHGGGARRHRGRAARGRPGRRGGGARAGRARGRQGHRAGAQARQHRPGEVAPLVPLARPPARRPGTSGRRAALALDLRRNRADPEGLNHQLNFSSGVTGRTLTTLPCREADADVA